VIEDVFSLGYLRIMGSAVNGYRGLVDGVLTIKRH